MIFWALGAICLALAIVGWLYFSEGAYLGKKAVIALYNWGAPDYDRVKEVLPEDDARHLARPLLQALQDFATPLILDVATGTARLPLALLRQWDFHGYIAAADLSPRMLEVARRKTQAHREHIGLILADGTALPFADEAFHAVTSLEALELMPKPEALLWELVRVLRPGGVLLVSNRVGRHAFFVPGHTYRPRVLEEKLHALGLIGVQTRRWQVHYDLVQASKPVARELAKQA